MSGHSKWSSIKHKKGAADAKRGKLFSKLARAIIVAAKEGGGDPANNLALQNAIEKARSYSMPKDNIDRAIAKGTGEGSDGAAYETVVYEGYGPEGVAVIVEALTDNRNRTATNVRTIFSKNGGNLGAGGSVSHGFERLGLIEYPASAGDSDKVFEAAIEAGAEDVESDEDGHRIWTNIAGLHEVARALEPMLGEAESAKLAWKPATEVEVRGDDASNLLRLIDALEEDDDVQTVWGNYDVPEDELEKLA
ncbi:MAG: YebC/PmpR family DNA-binding transcriptional regulator [Sphingomicrobium sp.]